MVPRASQMAALDTRTWIAAARRYMRLRRRYWFCFVGVFAVCATLGTPLFVFGDDLHPAVRGVLFTVLFVGFLACWLGSIVTWFTLLAFRCPRCGNRFLLSWTATTWPGSHCKHCRLDLRPAAMALQP